MTAEETLTSAYAIIAEKQSSLHSDVDPVLLNAIRKYGKQCAQEALKDAASSEKLISGVTISFSLLEQEAILETIIKTP